MLWYKAWLETRARFLACLGGMAILPSLYVYQENQGVARFARADWYYRALHTAHGMLALMWIAAVMFLMMGGLLREKALGTSSFTLALPVSRARLMRVRVVSGLIEAALLGIVSWSLMLATASTTGQANSIWQALIYLALLISGGSVYFGIAVLVSSLVEGEYLAPAICFGMLFLDAALLNGSQTMSFLSPAHFMMGSQYLDPKSHLLVGPVPALHFVACPIAAVVMIAAAMKAIEQREF